MTRLRLIGGSKQAAKGQPESCAVHVWQLIEKRTRYFDREGQELDPPAERRLERCQNCGLSQWR